MEKREALPALCCSIRTWGGVRRGRSRSAPYIQQLRIWTHLPVFCRSDLLCNNRNTLSSLPSPVKGRTSQTEPPRTRSYHRRLHHWFLRFLPLPLVRCWPRGNTTSTGRFDNSDHNIRKA